MDGVSCVQPPSTGTIVNTLADEEAGESFSGAYLGEAEEVGEERVGDAELIFVRGCKSQRAQAIVLRGANMFMLDEMERFVFLLEPCLRFLSLSLSLLPCLPLPFSFLFLLSSAPPAIVASL